MPLPLNSYHCKSYLQHDNFINGCSVSYDKFYHNDSVNVGLLSFSFKYV